MKRKIYNVTIKIKFETSINENPAAEIINSKDDRKKNIWDSLLGKNYQMEEFWNLML